MSRPAIIRSPAELVSLIDGSPTKLVGLLGQAGAGKGTTGEFIKRNFPEMRPHSFASKVKDIASDLFGYPRYLLEGDTIESRDYREIEEPFIHWGDGQTILSPRQVMQGIGEGLRQIYPDVWVDQLFPERGEIVTTPALKDTFITDVRYPNEALAIRNYDGIVIGISTSNMPYEGDDDLHLEIIKGHHRSEQVIAETLTHASHIIYTETVAELKQIVWGNNG